jgi:hypothetical protein
MREPGADLPAIREEEDPAGSEDAIREADDAAAAQVIPPEVLEHLPAEQKKQLLTAITTMLSIGPMPNPIAAKMTPTHISKVLDLQEKDMTFTYQDRRDSRLQSTVVFLVVLILGVAVVLILALNGHDSTLDKLIPIGAGLAGGFGSGYAVGRRRS